MNNAIIFNIQKFSIHDGPGIRTTIFFKGCPLSCLWCHNPEGINKSINLLYDYSKCNLCGECIKRCRSKALSIENEKVIVDSDKCILCGDCTFFCINGAREVCGKEYSINKLVDEVIKDKLFYEESGGGVTLSGGEPLMQVDIVKELLSKFKDQGINTAIDTSGYVPFSSFEKVYRNTDLFLYDLKLADEEKHKRYTGVSNKLILDNLKKLSELNANINIRMPIIEGVNESNDDIKKAIEFLKGIKVTKINILPYHEIAKHKYRKLGIPYQENKMKVPSENKMKEIKNKLIIEGYDVKIGG